MARAHGLRRTRAAPSARPLGPTPLLHQDTLSLERELTRNMRVRASYIGVKARSFRIAATRISRLLPHSPSQLRAGADNRANPRYDAIELHTLRRFRKCLFNSTWSQAKYLAHTGGIPVPSGS